MIRKLVTNGTIYLNGMLDNPDSMLYKLVQTAQNMKKMERIVEICYYVLWGIFGVEVLLYGYCLLTLRGGIFLLTSPILLCLISAASFALFAISTNYEKFNFWNRKRADLAISILFVVRMLVSMFSYLYSSILLPVVFLIPINRDITVGMVVWLARLLYAVCTLVPGIMIGNALLHAVFEEANWNEISSFKLRKVVDMRKDKEYKYDLSIIRYMKDGKPYVIKEKDRQRHMLLSGVTGTGKTSSALVPSVAQDLDHKAHNEDYVKQALLSRMLTEHDVYLTRNLKETEFDFHAFLSDTEEGKDFLKELEKKAPSAGLTVIAPNADFADAVYGLATSRGFQVNRIDPIPKDPATGQMKEGFIGFNPLYISPTLSEWQRKVEIFRKSRMTSDVLQALYDQGGKSDPYFSSLNRNLTTMLCILVMVTYPRLHSGAQPFLTDIQSIINDFSCVRPYLLALAQIMGVDDGVTDYRTVTADWLRNRNFGEYQFIVSQVSYDLLGAGRLDMEKQARGLRVIVNEFLTDPLIRGVLCAEKTVDIDLCLSEGQITVVNYALELGMSLATGFGLFYCLSFNQAVLRRPGNEDSRLLHLYYCDEFPVLMHRDMEQIFTLFRQFKVSFTCAFQTFSQFDRNDETEFLKKVILSNVGHHIVYGNCAPEEMELYEQLAGKELRFIEQQTVSETAITLPETGKSFSTRLTPSLENALEGYQMRNKDFQEVTVFGINQGDHVAPFDGKLSFLSEKQRKGEPRCIIDWSAFVDDRDEDVTFVRTGKVSEAETRDINGDVEKERARFRKLEGDTIKTIQDARKKLSKVTEDEARKTDDPKSPEGEPEVEPEETFLDEIPSEDMAEMFGSEFQ